MTVHVPVEVLARLGGDEFGWQVPALRKELITALIKSLPKDLRRNFVPAPDTARAVLASIAPDGEPILQALQRELHRLTRILVPIDAFDLDKLPPHLRVTFAVESEGTEVARGKISRPCSHSSSCRSVVPSPRRSQARWNERVCARGPTTSTNCPAPSKVPQRRATPPARLPFVGRTRAVRSRHPRLPDRGRAGGCDGGRESAGCCQTGRNAVAREES